MSHLRSILQQNIWFLLPFVLFVFTGLAFLYVFPKNEGFLLLNGLYSPKFDSLFKYITHLGDGFFTIAVVGVLFFRKLKWALLLFWSFLLSGAIAQFLKNFVFDEVLRPSLGVGMDHVHIVEGIELHHHLSLPSDHSTAAFALFFSLSLMNQNKKLGILYFAFAFITAYSRIYLSQHFPIDVLSGALIGVCTTLIVFAVLEPRFGQWSEKGLISKS